VLVAPTQGSAPDRVQIVVVTKDVWSIRLNWDIAFSNGGLETPHAGSHRDQSPRDAPVPRDAVQLAAPLVLAGRTLRGASRPREPRGHPRRGGPDLQPQRNARGLVRHPPGGLSPLVIAHPMVVECRRLVARRGDAPLQQRAAREFPARPADELRPTRVPCSTTAATPSTAGRSSTCRRPRAWASASCSRSSTAL
jgi:hypothetical protein